MINSKPKVAVKASFLLPLLFWLTASAQLRPPANVDDDTAQKKLELLSDLQGLGARAKQLDKPLARGMAEAEVADALWSIDRDLAKELLRDAHSLTFPEEEEQARRRRVRIGALPSFPQPLDFARSEVRARVLKVASRDKAFADELVQTANEKLGPVDAQMGYASLAGKAIEENDFEAARKYILKTIDAEPTQIAGPVQINQLAAKNRADADDLILSYIDRLNSLTLSGRDQSLIRAQFALLQLIHPESGLFGGSAGTRPPGPAVFRAYVAYTLNRITVIGQQSPENIGGYRLLLLHTYPLLAQYAPELKPQFLELEQLTRKPGEGFSAPSRKSLDEESKSKYEKQVSKELDSDHPDEVIIQRAISRGDFSKARKMIDKLDDGPQKTQLIDMLIVKQVIALANSGDIAGAQKLAEALVKATSILQVFPVIIAKCAANKDDACAGDAVYQAVRQLKKADVTPATPPPGMPASFMPTSRTFDPVLASLGKLAWSVLSVGDLAFDVLDELVTAANHSQLETSEGRTGFESSLFKKLAEKDEARTTAAALQLKDPLRQIVALAAIDQWKSDKLNADAKLRSAKAEAAAKKN
jgi:hypothetical protein